LAGVFLGVSSVEASASGVGEVEGTALSTEETGKSGVSKSVGSVSGARVSTVIVAANSFRTSPAVSGLAVGVH
jgi:hypothetical protein